MFRGGRGVESKMEPVQRMRMRMQPDDTTERNLFHSQIRGGDLRQFGGN